MFSCCLRSLAFVVAVAVPLASQARAADEPVRIFLLAGQSNMVGADAHAARIDDFPVFRGAGQPQDDVLYSYAVGGVAPAGEIWSPLRPLGSFGPELMFARRVKQSSPGRIAIIKSAVGGTTVAYDWNPDAPEQGQKLYPRTVQLVRDSLAELDRRQIRYRLEAVLWHQGEDAFLAQLENTPEFTPLAKPRVDIPFRYSLGGGVKSSSGWEPLGPVDYLGEFGPELSFGAAIRTVLDPAEGVAIVKFTHSGAQGPDWFPAGSPESRRNLYPRFSEFVKAAQSDLARQGFQCQLGGVFWHTGENDTYFGPYAQNHSRWLKQLIDRTRTDWQTPDLPWFVSEQPRKAPWKNQDQVNSSLRELASGDANLRVIPTDHLPHGKNLFGAEGLVRLGEAYAKAYRDAQR